MIFVCFSNRLFVYFSISLLNILFTMRTISTILLLLSLGFYSQTFSQFVLSGEFTPRTEMSHGYGTLANPDQDFSLFTAQRTRLNFFYTTDKVKTGLVLQDVRSWGNQSQLVKNEDMATSVHQAWAEVNIFENLAVKVGRQELVYDDSRIFGNVGWAHQARSHDLALIKAKSPCGINIHLGIAYNENTDRVDNLYGVEKSYKAMQFLWLNHKVGNFTGSILFLNNGKENVDAAGTSSAAEYSQTVGPRIVYKKDKLMFAATYYQQMGKAGGSDLSANYMHFEASYQLFENLNLKLGYESLSGNSMTDTASTEQNAFTPFYGTNHKFNGFMDYFYVGNHIGSVGLQDIYINITRKIKKAKVMAQLHMFSTNGDLIDAEGKTMDAALGKEIDLVFAYPINDIASFKLGYSHMLATESMEVLKGSTAGAMDEMNNWAWIMLSVKPKFLNQ